MGNPFPWITVMSCGEIGADVSVASTLPACFGLAMVDTDHATAIAAIATIMDRMTILRISHHLRVLVSWVMDWHDARSRSVRRLTQN
jgi:hypothetical protein